jgi:hypothetical protein
MQLRGQRARRSWLLVLVGAIAAIVVLAPVAHAQGPLDEVGDQAGDTVSGVVDGLGDPDPVDEVIDTVGDATGVDTTPLKEVKEKVDSTVDRVLDEAPDTGGGVQPGTGVVPNGPAGSPASRPGAENRSENDARSRPAAAAPEQRSALRRAGAEPEVSGAAGDVASQARGGSEDPSRPARVAGPRTGSVPRVIRNLAFPFILGLAVAMFLGVQSRIDGTDTKLLQAPQDTHYLSFQ